MAITNYAPMLYKKFEQRYEQNKQKFSRDDVAQEQVGFLKRPTVKEDDTTSPADMALDMWAQIREAREELKRDKGTI